eukprot:9047430-Pyramimonas_sp.AAC.1
MPGASFHMSATASSESVALTKVTKISARSFLVKACRPRRLVGHAVVAFQAVFCSVSVSATSVT